MVTSFIYIMGAAYGYHFLFISKRVRLETPLDKFFCRPAGRQSNVEHIAVYTLWSIVLLAALCTGLLQTTAFKARGVGPRAWISMAAQRPAARRLLLRGQRPDNSSR